MGRKATYNKYVGQVINGFKVLRLTNPYIREDGYQYPRFILECTCGNKFVSYMQQLKNKSIKGCGCVWWEGANKKSKRDRIYSIWRKMVSRCYNVKEPQFKHYGGRGIIVCNEWKNNYHSFKEWANLNGYADALTIDRRNGDGNYEPENCRWVTMGVQMKNRRKSTKALANAVKEYYV